MNARARRARIAILLAIAGLTVVISSSVGPAKVPAMTTVSIMASRVLGLSAFVSSDISPTDALIVLEVRLPRIVLGLLVGAALSVAGSAFQGMLRNPLADPYIIGVSSGAALGASVGILLAAGTYTGWAGHIPVLAFIGAVLTVVFVYALANVGGRLPTDTFLLAGVVVGSFIWALVSFIMVIAGQDLPKVVMWLMGSLSAKGWAHVRGSAPYIIAGIVGLMLMARDFNLIAAGEESARYMGLDVEGFKRKAIIAGSLITAAAVASSGLIGFVGLIVPHITRMLIGPDHRSLIPVSAIGGAIMLVWADTLARTVLAPMEIPVGIITALAGAPFFFYLLRRRRSQAIF